MKEREFKVETDEKVRLWANCPTASGYTKKERELYFDGVCEAILVLSDSPEDVLKNANRWKLHHKRENPNHQPEFRLRHKGELI